jgi:hypothetical protein
MRKWEVRLPVYKREWEVYQVEAMNAAEARGAIFRMEPTKIEEDSDVADIKFEEIIVEML